MNDDLRSKFTDAGEDENQLLLGQQSGSLSERSSIMSPTKENQKSSADEKAKRRIDYLDLIQQMQEELNNLNIRMQETYARLEAKYGEDVVGAMAATYLDEDVLRSLKSDDERLRALADKFLDTNGEIKDKYKHLDEAAYVRDWHRAQILAPVVEKYQGRDTLTPDEKREIQEAAAQAGLAENARAITISSNTEHKSAIDKQLEGNRATSEQITTDTGFNFD